MNKENHAIKLTTTDVMFQADAELVEQLNERANGFPHVSLTNGVASLNRAEAQAWMLDEQKLSRTALVDANVARTLFSDNDNSGLGKISDEDWNALSRRAQDLIMAIGKKLNAAHLAARAKLVDGEVYSSEDLFVGLREGDAVLMRTENGELPCIVTELNTYQSFMGVSLQFSMAYLGLRNNGLLSWYKCGMRLGVRQTLSRKNADLSLLVPETVPALLARGQQYIGLASQSRYAMCRGSLKVERGWNVMELPLEGRVMADPIGSHRTVPRIAGSDNAFGPDYPLNLFAPGTAMEKYLAYTPQWVPGFSFKHKAWGLLSLDELYDIEFREQAFDQLVLDDEVKETVHALVKHSEGSFSDFIEGKSGGCIFLLYGPPGAGKTLTAEAVAEVLHRPLYVVNVGELGTTPEELERALKSALQTAERWNAVVLLDEADIFLERRTSTDVVRNALVGIFLRELEYYKGVMFLTTNRAASLDPAIISRVSLGLRYQNLDIEGRLKVWSNLATAALGSQPAFCLKEFAEKEMNGRQIKNALRLALTLAKSKGSELMAEHLRTSITLTQQFMTDCNPEAFE